MDEKYPNSANLFRFCRRVLDHKYGSSRVIDQDVGQILNFDPADCSHWKRGKKNVRSVEAIKKIANLLEVDEKVIFDMACGEITEVEAFYEFSGYGDSTPDHKMIEVIKKDFYRKNLGNWTKDTEFMNSFYHSRQMVVDTVRGIHETIRFTEPPLYLPEICAHYPQIELKDSLDREEHEVSSFLDGEKKIIFYKKGSEIKPYIRYLIGKAMADFFLPPGKKFPEMQEYMNHLEEVNRNRFASMLLAPTFLIQKEFQKLDLRKDILSQLSENFWVSRSFMNRRMKDLILEEI